MWYAWLYECSYSTMKQQNINSKNMFGFLISSFFPLQIFYQCDFFMLLPPKFHEVVVTQLLLYFVTHIFILIVCLFNTLSLNPWCAKGKCLFIIMCFFLAPFAFNLRIAKWRCSNTHNFRESFIIITKEKCTRRSLGCVFFGIRKCYNMQDKNETLLLWNAYNSEALMHGLLF